jgi:hypothetical protein
LPTTKAQARFLARFRELTDSRNADK